MTRFIFVFLLLAAFALGVLPCAQAVEFENDTRVDFFYIEGCSRCAEQDVWNKEFAKEGFAHFVYHNVGDPKEAAAFSHLLEDHNRSFAVPVTVVKGRIFVGFDEQVAGKIRAQVKGKYTASQVSSRYPLWLLAVTLGFLDGVNPCAMWVLLFLIGLLIGVLDKARLWLFGLVFLASSGALYFLFLTAWLNVFLAIGYVRAVQVFVGFLAVLFGLQQLREFVRTKGALVCKVTREKKTVVQRIERLVRAPLTWGIVGGIVALAFSVNAIEFLCSSALPVVFTETLALHGLPVWQYYAYVLLYDLFFLLDDFLVFLLAVWAIPHVGERYAGWCRLVSAVILVVIGFLLVFFPHALM